MLHSFDKEIALKYGIPEAIVLQNIIYWIRKNQANGRHFYDGYTWTYNSAAAFVELFPYWTEKQIYHVINKLINKHKVLATANYNELKYDRTRWFTIIDKWILQKWEIHFTNLSNGIDKSVRPIPLSKPNSKLNSKLLETSEKISDPKQKKIDPKKKNGATEFTQCRQIWEALYKRTYGVDYYFAAKDAKALSELVKKIEYNTKGQYSLVDSFNHLTTSLMTDKSSWWYDKLSLTLVCSQYNQIVANYAKSNDQPSAWDAISQLYSD